MYLHREFNGIGLTSPFQIKRSEPNEDGLTSARGLVGTGLWAMSQMYDATETLVPFYIDVPRLLVCRGHLTIRHRGIPVAPYGGTYAMYGHAKIHLWGPYATQAAIPALDWTRPGPMVALHGMNIANVIDHYAAPTFDFQKMLQPGFYRIEFYAGAGSDASDVDGLAELPNFGQQYIHQVGCVVY